MKLLNKLMSLTKFMKEEGFVSKEPIEEIIEEYKEMKDEALFKNDMSYRVNGDLEHHLNVSRDIQNYYVDFLENMVEILLENTDMLTDEIRELNIKMLEGKEIKYNPFI